MASSNKGLRFRLLRLVARAVQAYPPPGIDRVLRAIYSPNGRQHDHIETVLDYDSDLLIKINTASYIEWSIFFYGYYEREVSKLIKHLVRPGDAVLDVGANIGCHTLLMAMAAGASGRVVAAEPHPAIYVRLAENIRLNHMQNVQLVHCGLSDAPGEATLYTAPGEVPNQGMASLYRRPALSHAIPVPLQTLDGLVWAYGLSRLALVKVDTQGNDNKVLLGGERSIREFRPQLLFEYDEREWGRAGADFAACEMFLRTQHYTVYVLDAAGALTAVKEGLPESANILAVPAG